MKRVIIINGTPGVGKTTISKELHNEMTKSAWIDGDWCWTINPFVVNDENKRMVENNINYLLNSYLSNSSIDVVIVNWVINSEKLMSRIVESIVCQDVEIFKYTLTCDEICLEKRLILDSRSQERISDSIKRLPQYDEMDTVKIETTNKGVNEIIKEIKADMGKQYGKLKNSKSKI